MSQLPSHRHGVAAVLSVLGLSACANVLGLTNLHDGICAPGATQECAYTGPPGTKDVGICKAATQVCAGDGQSWGTCYGEILPMPAENCTTPVDDNCNGQVNEPSAGCCTPPSTLNCYDGPGGTEGVGNCVGGMKTCSTTTDTYGTCMGEIVPATEDCYTKGDEDCDGNACSDPVWNLAFNDGGGEQITGMAIDSKGDVYLAGYFTTVVSVNGTTFSAPHSGHQQYFLVKVDHQGSHGVLWYKQIGDGNDNGANIQVTVAPNDDVVISGDLYASADFGGGTKTAPTGQDSAFLAKYDSQGTYQWGEIFGDVQGAYASAVAIDAQGNIIIGGTSFGGTLNFTTTTVTGSGGFTAGFAANGDNVWSMGLPSAIVTSIAVTPSTPASTFLTGGFTGTLKLGTNTFVSSGARDVFLAKLDATGKPIMSAAYGSPADDYGNSIAVSPTGSVFMVGAYGGTINFGTGSLTSAEGTGFAAAFDTSLVPAWSKGFVAYDHPYVASDTKGDVFLTGTTVTDVNFGAGSLTISGAVATYLVKFDGTGAVLWNKLFSTQKVTAAAVARDPTTGNVAIAGVLTGSISFGLPPLNGSGNIYLAEFQY